MKFPCNFVTHETLPAAFLDVDGLNSQAPLTLLPVRNGSDMSSVPFSNCHQAWFN